MDIKISLPQENIADGVSFLRQKSVRETYRLHTHDFYEFFYIVHGKAIHEINGENQILSEGDFVLIRPWDAHKYSFLDNFDFEMISVGFSCENFNSALNMLETEANVFTEPAMPPVINLYGYNLTDIYRKLCRIERTPIGAERRIYFKSILPYLLYRFISYGEEQPRTVVPAWFAEVINEMSRRENYIAGLPKLLEIAHSSQEHITREFRRRLDVTPTEFINIKRLNFAAELIADGKTEITDICFACGFNNLSHFYHCFKQRYGCTPKQFASKQADSAC